MPTDRLSMRKTREILRLKWLLKRSHREIQRTSGAGLGTISETATRAAAALLDWSAVEQLDDDDLEARLYPPATTSRRPLPEPAHLHVELRRAGVTLRLLHEEYLGAHADGVRLHAVREALPDLGGGTAGRGDTSFVMMRPTLGRRPRRAWPPGPRHGATWLRGRRRSS